MPDPMPWLPLKDIVRQTSLGTPARGHSGSGAIRLIKMGSIGEGRVGLDQTELVSRDLIDGLPSISLRTGDVLFNTRNTPQLVGKVGIWQGDGVESVPDNNLLLMRFADTIDARYMNYQLGFGEPSRMIPSLAQGTTSVAAIYWRDLQHLLVPAPELAEQQRVANVLDEVGMQIDSLAAIEQKKRRVKEGVISRLLAGDDGWRSMSIGDLGRVVTGRTPTVGASDGTGRDIPFVTPTEVTESGRVVRPNRAAEPDSAGLTAVPARSTLAVCIGFGIGKVGLLEFDACVNQQINALIPAATMDPTFVFHLISSVSHDIKMRSGLQVTPIVNKTEFSKIAVRAPDLAEQTRISEVIARAVTEVETLQAEIKKLQSVKRALMEDLLTGRVRTPVPS
ncbi:restriction endonuclease subunit S [Streptomyces sp. NPDC060031]|uniref:restriction endonuclease subunit S n=1 Tax=Streptomyces sp. NPDC060031 TaxID=3347043 RepID=UPI00368F0709